MAFQRGLELALTLLKLKTLMGIAKALILGAFDASGIVKSSLR